MMRTASVCVLLALAVGGAVSAGEGRPATPAEAGHGVCEAMVRRLDGVARAYAEKEDQLRRKKTALKEMAEALGVDDRLSGSLKDQMVMEQLLDARIGFLAGNAVKLGEHP